MGIAFLIKSFLNLAKEPINYITLSFPAEQEKNFQKKYFRDSLNFFRTAFLLVTILYASFAIVDTTIAKEYTNYFFLIRFLVVIPFLLCIYILSYFRFFEKIWQWLIFISIIIGGSGIIAMIQKLPVSTPYFLGLMLVLSAGYFFIKLRFILATLAGWLIVCIFNVVMIVYSEISNDLIITLNFFFISANLINMVAAYNIELYDRRNYLISIKLENKTNELEDTNKNLEELVFERTKELAYNESALREKMELFQALFNASPDAIFLIDPYDTKAKWPIIDCNNEACKMNGYTREEMIGQSIDLLNTRTETPEERKAYIDKIKAGKVIRIETTHRHKNGNTFPIEVSTSVINIGGKELILGIDRDITRRKQIEEEIRNLNSELEIRVEKRTEELMESNKELEAFAYSVSHDLRTPLRAINSFAEILVEEYSNDLDDEAKRICSVIRDNSLKMGKLIDGLLNFSRLNRTKLKKSKVNMRKLIEAVYEELPDPQKKQKIKFTVTHKIYKAVADEALIKQVWINLIENAVKFSSLNAEPEIEISSTKESDRIIYSIKDNGAGFDMQYINKLFGVFQRLHSDKEFEGTGVGLALVQRIIHRHGGQIWASGEPGNGAIFCFSLPK
jgi:PAS domain S-box-containing protein